MTYTDADILKDEEFKSFMRGKTLKKGSKRIYVHNTREYCNFNDMSLTELIDEAEKEQESGKIKLRRRKVNQRIGDFVQHLTGRKLAAPTIRSYIMVVKALYRHCEINLDKIAQPKLSNNKIFDEVITFDKIKTCIQNANSRERAIFFQHLSSGMGMSEVRNLKYKDFLKSLDQYTNRSKYIPVEELIEIMENVENPIPRWKTVRFKTSYPYLTFSSPESCRATLFYLNERQNSRFPITSGDDYLFTSKGKRILERNYLDIFQRTNDKNELGKRPNGYRVFTSHELRRFFVTQCSRGGVDKLKVDAMVGHAINPTDAAYFKINENELKEDYKKALKFLTLDRVENITIESPEVTELRKELLESQKQNREFAKLLKNRGEFEKLPKPI